MKMLCFKMFHILEKQKDLAGAEKATRMGRYRCSVALTWLANEEAHIISENRCVTVQEITRQLHHDRKFCQLFKDLSGLDTRKRFYCH